MIDTEALRNKYSPDGSSLRETQLRLLEEILVIDGICKEHGLTYFLIAGSALGAMRHQGFIPWDDDIDIALFKDDYKKLKKILLEKKSDRFVLHCRETDFNYIFGFPKYRAKEGDLLGCFPARGVLYKYKGDGVDIFCVSRHSFHRAWICAKTRAALLNWVYKLKNTNVRRIVTGFNWFLFSIIKILSFPLDLLRKKDELHYDLGSGTPFVEMRYSEIFPVKNLEFEGKKLSVPGNIDAYLTRIFGNYMELPSEEQIRNNLHNKDFLPEKP